MLTGKVASVLVSDRVLDLERGKAWSEQHGPRLKSFDMRKVSDQRTLTRNKLS